MERRKKRKILRVPLDDWERFVSLWKALPEREYMNMEHFIHSQAILDIKNGEKYIRAAGETV